MQLLFFSIPFLKQDPLDPTYIQIPYQTISYKFKTNKQKGTTHYLSTEKGKALHVATQPVAKR
jgi:hypothetical protein